MKKCAILLAAVSLLAFSSCTKERNCRCAVIHGQSLQTIRLITIDKGTCEDLRFVFYDHDILTPDVTDSVLCTDYDFGTENN